MFRRSLIGSRLIFGIFLAGSLFCGAEADPTFQPTVSAQSCAELQQRKISFTAVNNEGQLIENLGKDDLALTEDKVPIEILSLQSRAAEPVAVGVLIDISVSQESTLPRTKLIAQKFLESVLSNGSDRAALVSFSTEAKIEQDLTNDLGKLRAAIGRLKVIFPPGYVGGGVLVTTSPPKGPPLIGSTAIWDAILATTENLSQAAPNARRVIVLLTDGEDTGSKAKIRDAVTQAATSDVKIFSIGIGDEKNFALNEGKLRKLSEETGGLAFFPKKVGDLESIFNRIEKEIRSQYLLTYCTAEQKSDKSPRKVEIQLKNPVLRQSKPRLSYRRYI